MSEFLSFREDIEENRKRISELEANTIISNELQIKINDKLQDYIKINTSNIQNNFKGFKDFKFLQESQMKRCDHLQEQIAELGKRIGNAWESISELEASSASHAESFSDQFTELREELKIHLKLFKKTTHINTCTQLMTKHNKEIDELRELVNKIWYKDLIYLSDQLNELKASDKDTNEAFADVSVKFIELEKKAEWNGKQIVDAFNSLTEKHSMIAELKEDCKDYRIETRRIEQIYKKNYNELKEDSGDDKKYIDPVKQTWYNTKTHIVVKREDFEFLYEHCYLNRPNEEPILKRIKEEYNL